jgi:hypothetical protein
VPACQLTSMNEHPIPLEYLVVLQVASLKKFIFNLFAKMSLNLELFWLVDVRLQVVLKILFTGEAQYFNDGSIHQFKYG